MNITAREGTLNRQVLTAMVVSRSVLAPIATRWTRDGLFGSRWENLIAGWAVEHYRQYRKSPGAIIQDYFDRWVERGRQDPEVVRAIEDFLAGLSDEYQRLKQTLSPDYLLDRAGELFDRVAVRALRDELDGDLIDGDIKRARTRINKFRPVEIGLGAGTDVFAEPTDLEAAMSQQIADNLIHFGQESLDRFFRGALARDCFVAGMGKAKVGKSFWLMDMACTALESNRNVAMFEVGDMSKGQVMRRLAARMSGIPVSPDSVVRWPNSMETEPGQMPRVVREVRRPDPLTLERATQVWKEHADKYGGDRFKLSVHPNSSISVSGIETILEGWERDGWVPDVVAVDYADILAPMDGRADTRDQINATWKALRALSQRLHCLVLTVTQADAGSYDARTLSRGNFTDDRRKYDHVTGMFGINQTSLEKDEELYRLNWIVLRELEFSEETCLWTAACLPIARPAILTSF